MKQEKEKLYQIKRIHKKSPWTSPMFEDLIGQIGTFIPSRYSEDNKIMSLYKFYRCGVFTFREPWRGSIEIQITGVQLREVKEDEQAN